MIVAGGADGGATPGAPGTTGAAGFAAGAGAAAVAGALGTPGLASGFACTVPPGVFSGAATTPPVSGATRSGVTMAPRAVAPVSTGAAAALGAAAGFAV